MYDIIEGIKLQYMEQKIIMNEENLKKLGYYNIALEMLLKREAQINPEDIIMPGDERTDIQQDYSNVEIILENLKSQIVQILNTAKSLPEFLEGEEGPDDSAYYDYRRSLVDSLEEAGSKISSLLIENMQFESSKDLDNSLQQ